MHVNSSGCLSLPWCRALSQLFGHIWLWRSLGARLVHPAWPSLPVLKNVQMDDYWPYQYHTSQEHKYSMWQALLDTTKQATRRSRDSSEVSVFMLVVQNSCRRTGFFHHMTCATVYITTNQCQIFWWKKTLRSSQDLTWVFSMPVRCSYQLRHLPPPPSTNVQCCLQLSGKS